MIEPLNQDAALAAAAAAAPVLQAPVRHLLEELRRMALKASGRHSAACDKYERRDSFYGIGSTVLTAIVGSTIFVTLQKTASESRRIIAGLVAAIAAVASSIQTAAKYGQLAERYRQAIATTRLLLDGSMKSLLIHQPKARFVDTGPAA